MTRTAQIDYPHPYDDRSEQSKKETLIARSCFMAWGAYTGSAHEIYGELLQGGTVKCKGKLIASDPPLWTVLFEGVADGDYDLAIRRGEGGRKLTSQRGIKVKAPTPAQGGGPGRKITIQHPLSADCPLPSNFPATGTTDTPQYPVSGVIQQPSGPPIPGKVTQQVGGTVTTWVIQFSNVPPGTNYTLTVKNTNGDQDQSPDLTVD